MAWHDLAEFVKDWLWAPILGVAVWLIRLDSRVKALEASVELGNAQRAAIEARHEKQRAEDREALKEELGRLFAEIKEMRSDLKEVMRRGG